MCPLLLMTRVRPNKKKNSFGETHVIPYLHFFTRCNIVACTAGLRLQGHNYFAQSFGRLDLSISKVSTNMIVDHYGSWFIDVYLSGSALREVACLFVLVCPIVLTQRWLVPKCRCPIITPPRAAYF